MASRVKTLEDSMAHLSEDTICVAVGKDVEEGKSILLWAFHHSGGKRICILYVHQPAKLIRNPLGPTKIPAEYVNETLVSKYQEGERLNVLEILDKYDQLCGKMGVRVERLQTEMESIEEGIVQLITRYGIRKLVMGAAAEKHYNRKMMGLRSKNAKYVCERAPVSCCIQFICKGCLIHTRKAGTDTETRQSNLAIMRSRSVPSRHNRKNAETAHSNYLRSLSVAKGHDRNSDQLYVLSRWSPSGSGCTTSSPRRMIDLTLSPLPQPSPEFDEFEFSAFSPAFGCSSSSSLVEVASYNRARSVVDRSLDNTLYEKLQQVTAEAEKLTVWHQKAARDLSQAMGKAQDELIHRKEIDEAKAKAKGRDELEKVKNQIDQVMEKCRSFEEYERSVKRQIAELQVERDNALKEVEELRNKGGECSSGHMPPFCEFSLSEIKEATQNFNESLKIGEGGYGNIYKAHLRQTEVAIKRLHSHCGQGSSEFQTEVRVLSQLRHPNLVKLIGSCPEEFALIYEYLSNGSLEDRLRCRDKSPPLSWQTRIRIAAELCSVLVYLHSSKPHSIVHGDLKPSNILLDSNLVCKLSDFGICRVLCHDQISNNSTTLFRITDAKGTVAYVDPDFCQTRVLTLRADVYSFGIILLQLLTARPPFYIADEVKYALDDGKLEALLDPLAGDWPIVVAQTLAELALRCCDRNPKKRPELGSDVWEVLESMRVSSVASSSSQLGPEAQYY